MFKQILVFATLAALLCGCVLQSRSPLYGDNEAQLALGAAGGPVLVSNWRDGKWEADAERVEITVTGNHYEAMAKPAAIALHFVPLGGLWFVLQAVEAGKPAVYMLAEVKDKSAEVYSLPCSDLKKDAGIANWISYEGDDCFIEPGAPASTLFAALLKTPGEPSSRFELLK